MAKWGEGDPRWIVEERADATNVNNWHWTEKNATGWSKELLEKLLVGLSVENRHGCAEITSVESMTGEASVSHRKTKLIFFFEWVIKCQWKGLLTETDEEVKGTLEIPNLADENEPEEVTVDVTIDKDQPKEASKIKDLIRIEGLVKIQSKMKEYMDSLRKEFSQGMILPSKPKDSTQSTATQSDQLACKVSNCKLQPGEQKPSESKLKLRYKDLSISQDFMCSVEDLYRVFTDPGMLGAFTRTKIETPIEKDQPFSLFDGNVTGKYIEFQLNKKIVQLWRLKAWPAEYHSVVTLTFSQTGNGSQISLKQKGIPESEMETAKTGWKNYYWNSIKGTFGYGSNIF